MGNQSNEKWKTVQDTESSTMNAVLTKREDVHNAENNRYMDEKSDHYLK